MADRITCFEAKKTKQKTVLQVFDLFISWFAALSPEDGRVCSKIIGVQQRDLCSCVGETGGPHSQKNRIPPRPHSVLRAHFDALWLQLYGAPRENKRSAENLSFLPAIGLLKPWWQSLGTKSCCLPFSRFACKLTVASAWWTDPRQTWWTWWTGPVHSLVYSASVRSLNVGWTQCAKQPCMIPIRHVYFYECNQVGRACQLCLSWGRYF